MLLVLRNMLSKIGYPDVDVTVSGTEALRMMRTRDEEGRQYAAAILDQTMAPMTGVDLRRAMAGNRTFARIPALLMTSDSVAAGLPESVRGRFSSVLLKPF